MKILLLTGFFFFHLSFMDAANFWQLGFQDPATPIMEGIVEFHNHLMVFLAAIATFVAWLIFRCLSIIVIMAMFRHHFLTMMKILLIQLFLKLCGPSSQL